MARPRNRAGFYEICPSIEVFFVTQQALPLGKVPATEPARTFASFKEITDFLWTNAERMRGAYKPHEYDKVILPLLVVRRLDCVLAPSKEKVLARLDTLKEKGMKATDPAVDVALRKVTGVPFYNTSKLDFAKLKGDANHLAQNLRKYLKEFSGNARDIIEQFKFDEQITRLDDANLLFQIVGLFADVNLHPDAVPNHVMGSVFEELIRRFNEKKNEEAGDHYTPREIIRLMVDLLFIEDDDMLRKPGIVKSLFDPACGTGGMLSVAEDYLRELNPGARLEVYGQELNPESYAICKSDMIIKGQNPENIIRGNSFDQDGHGNRRFDYMLSNPPFGVDWKNVQKFVEDEHAKQGHAGRFGVGLPRINDGALLFLQHMLAKMKPADPKAGNGGSRIAIVLNGSPLFTGDVGSGESEIRRWVLEHDLVEAIVALPDQLFYNTGISTYIWILTNRKPKHRRGKVQLINAVELFQKMRKSLGNKRNELSSDHIRTIATTFGDFRESEISRILDNEDFGYRRIIIERPLRLRFTVTEDRLGQLAEDKAFRALATSKGRGKPSKAEAASGAALQEGLMHALRALKSAEPGTEAYLQRRCVCEHSYISHLGLSDSEKLIVIGSPVVTQSDEMTKTVALMDHGPCHCGCAAFKDVYDAVMRDREHFTATYTRFLRYGGTVDSGTVVPAPVQKAIVAIMGDRDETAAVCTDAKRRPEPDGELRDYESVPLKEDIATYFEREVKPHLPDAWVAGVEMRAGKAVVVDESKVRIGYEIPITRQFYKYKPLRPLAEIEAEIRTLEAQIQVLLGEVLQ